MSQRSQREEEHLVLAKVFFNSNKNNDFNHIHLIRPALSRSVVEEKSITTEMFDREISAPFFINAMTGGSDALYTISRHPAKAVIKGGIPMALDSVSTPEKEIDRIKSFETAWRENSDGLSFININPTTSLKVTQKIVDTLDANVL